MIIEVGDIAFLRVSNRGPKVLTIKVSSVMYHRDGDLNGGKVVQTAPTSYQGRSLTGTGGVPMMLGFTDVHVIDVLKKKIKEEER